MEQLPEEKREPRSFPEAHEVPLTVDLMKQIHEKEKRSIIGEDAAQKLAEQVGISQDKAQAILDRPDFQENLQALQKKRIELGKKFRRNLTKASLALLGICSFQEVRAESTSQESPIIEKVLTSKESVSQEISLDTQSALALRAQELPVHAYSSGEQELFREMYARVFNAQNEWGYSLSTDKKGIEALWQSEMYSLGGSIPFNGKQKNIFGHTHPLAAAEKADLQKGIFIMPPSLTDAVTCVESRATTNYIADPRGIWEYRCDPKGNLAKASEKITGDIEKVFRKVLKKFALNPEELKEFEVLMQDTHPLSIGSVLEGKFEEAHPGFGEAFESMYEEIMGEKNKQSLAELFRYAEAVSQVVLISQKNDDQATAKAMEIMITAVRKQGVFLAYTPYQKGNEEE